MNSTTTTVLGFLLGILLIPIVLAFRLVIWAGILWVAVWALHALGIYTIGSFAVAFSWPLAIIVAIVLTFLKTAFGESTKINNNKN